MSATPCWKWCFTEVLIPKVLHSYYIFTENKIALFSFLGFQTHTTPVLLAQGERAELATEEYLPLTPIMEGFVILRKNPDY